MMIRRTSVAAAMAACAISFSALSTVQAVAELAARVPATIGLGAGSVLWLEGKSNLHDFESRTSEVAIAITRDSSAGEPGDAAAVETFVRSSRVLGLDVTVPVTTLRSGKSGLDKNLWRNLRAEQYPAIHFHLSHYTLTPRGATRDTIDIQAEGVLSVAGRDRSETLTARAFHDTLGIWLEGSQPLLMTDFDIRPPTMMLGTLRCDNRITVRYRLLLAPRGTGNGTAAKGANEREARP